MSLSNYLENAFLDHLSNVAAMTVPPGLHVSLHTADPGEDGTLAEVSGNGYQRQAIVFGPASGGTAANTSAESWTPSGGNWGTVTHFAVWDAAAGGNCLFLGPLDAAKVANDGDDLTLAVGALTLTLD